MQMNISQIEAQVAQILEQSSKIKEDLKKHFKNDNNSFESRWRAFKQFHKLGGCHSPDYYTGWDKLQLFSYTRNSIDWAHDFDLSRYEEYDLVESGLDFLMAELWYEADDVSIQSDLAKAYIAYVKDSPENYTSSSDFAVLQYKHPIMVEAAEALMRDGITSFTYDW